MITLVISFCDKSDKFIISSCLIKLAFEYVSHLKVKTHALSHIEPCLCGGREDDHHGGSVEENRQLSQFLSVAQLGP